MKKAIYILFLLVYSLNAKSLNLSIDDVMLTLDKNKLKEIIVEYNDNLNFSYQDLFVFGVAYHNLAQIEEKLDYSLKAVEILEKANLSYKKDHNADSSQILVYLGSSNTLIGRDSKKIAKKVSSVNLGLSQMDKAVEIDKNNILLRVVRSSNNVQLPEMFARNSKIIEDLEFIEKNDKQLIYKNILKQNYILFADLQTNNDLKKKYLNKAKEFN